MIHSVGEKPVFQCELCPTTCGRKTDLRIHIQKLHTSDEPIKCKRCHNSFPDRYTYKLHAKTHEGEKCYRCDVCPYASISARHLESHLLIHTDQKPFVCSHCDQAFRQKQLLKRHENLYHVNGYVPPTPKEKTHKCPTCEKAFRHKGNLIRHMSYHDPDVNPSTEFLSIKSEAKPKETLRSTSDLIEEDSNLIACEGDDGQSYVVLEVIHVPDGENENDSQEELEDDDNLIEEDTGDTIEEHLDDEIDMEEGQDENEFILNDDDVIMSKSQTNDMSTFFGFDSDDGDSK